MPAPFRPEWHDIPAAFALLTRLPVPVDHARAGARGANTAWAFPLVGAIVGGISGALGWAASHVIGWELAVLLALGTQIALTGALHEDGLADSVDGFWGGRDRDRRLAIMKDSRIGTYGVLALVFVVLARWEALQVLTGTTLIAGMISVGALSRYAIVLTWTSLPAARPDGLSGGMGSPHHANALWAGLLCAMLVGPACLVTPAGVAGAVLQAGIVLAVLNPVWRLARARVGGQTGDILGATQQVTELAALVVLAAMLAT